LQNPKTADIPVRISKQPFSDAMAEIPTSRKQREKWGTQRQGTEDSLPKTELASAFVLLLAPFTLTSTVKPADPKSLPFVL
jgi:hypothetical protein